MKYIIQQIALDLARKITEKWINDGITNLDMFTADETEDCKQSAIVIIEAILEHMNKQIREDKESRKNLGLAIKEKDRYAVDNILQELLSAETDKGRIEKIKELGTHLNLTWESITNRYEKEMTGSCTEPQVSHVLSKRFSRNPMGWSEAALRKLTGIRIYLKNGDKIRAEHIKPHKSVTKYREYADKIVKDVMKENLDWSVFDIQSPVFNTGSVTQIRIHGFGRINNTLVN